MPGKVVALSKAMNNLGRAQLDVNHFTRFWDLGQKAIGKSRVERMGEMVRLHLEQAQPSGRWGNRVGILEVVLGWFGWP